jgi:hypothetical protein
MVEVNMALEAQIDGDGRNSPAYCTLKSSLASLYLKLACSGS